MPVPLHAPDENDTPPWPQTFPIAPLIRLTLIGLYVALTAPLPFLARVTQAPVSPQVLAIALGVGLVLLSGGLSERVTVDAKGIRTAYAPWFPFRQGWSLAWTDITAIQARTTGQGGMVYYLRDREGKGYLLPMRMAGFARFTRIVAQQARLDMTDVKPLAQPWMYFALLACTVLLLLTDSLAIAAAMASSSQVN